MEHRPTVGQCLLPLCPRREGGGSAGWPPGDGTLAAVADPTPPASDREPDQPSADPVPEVDDAMLERLEADLATIEAAMDRVDSGDLEGYGAVAARLDDEVPEAT